MSSNDLFNGEYRSPNSISFLVWISVYSKGHFGETWGLCEQKSDNQFITCAYDHHVKLWDSAEHKAVWDIEVEVSYEWTSFYYGYKAKLS